jgi:hypothetical protein
MSREGQAMSKLDELLSRLPSADKSPQSLVYEGKAVSRDKKTLHLAVSSGVLAIPLADIVGVEGLSGQSNDIVSVSVKSADGVKQIRHASPMFRRGGLGGVFGGGVFGGGVFGNSSDTFSNGRYIDSATASGGVADATDDTFWVEEADDIWT